MSMQIEDSVSPILSVIFCFVMHGEALLDKPLLYFSVNYKY